VITYGYLILIDNSLLVLVSTDLLTDTN